MLIEKQSGKENKFGINEIVKIGDQLGTVVGFSDGKYKVRVNNADILVEEAAIQKRSLLLS